MYLLVLCAIKGAQQSNQPSGVLAAARVLPVCVVLALCAQGGRKRFVWPPGLWPARGRWESGRHTIVFWRENPFIAPRYLGA